MRLYILSDLHLECADFTPLIRDADLTILAGDIHTKRRGVAWAAANFPPRRTSWAARAWGTRRRPA